jgi:integrase
MAGAVWMPTRRARRTAGDGTVSAYQTQAGERYLIKYGAPTTDGVGTRQVLRRGFRTRRDAAAELRTALAKLANGSHLVPSKITLGEYLTNTWLPALRLKPSTTASYRKNVRLHVVPHVGAGLLTSLIGQRLTALYRKLETDGRADGQEGGLSPRTVRYIHTIVHRALRDAVEDGLLQVNPADRAKPPTVAQSKAPELRYWTPAQPGWFLSWPERDEDELFVAWQLLAATGARRGEILALRWGDVDFKNARVAIRRSAVLVKNHGEGETVEIGTPKSTRARVVDIDPRTVAALKSHRQMLAGLDLQLARDDGFVVPAGDGGVRHAERFSRSFQTRVRRAGRELGEDVVPAIRLHDVRHTHATALIVRRVASDATAGGIRRIA